MGSFARQIEVFETQKADPYWENVVLYTRMDVDPPVDLSNSGHIFTTNGGTLDITDKKFGAASMSFSSATTQYVSTPDSTDWDFADREFTIEGWVYFDSSPSSGDDPVFFGQYDTSTDASWMLSLNNHQMRFSYSTTGTDNLTFFADWVPVLETWYHIAATRDAGGQLRMFVDGSYIGGGALGTTVLWDSAVAMHIGWPVDMTGSNTQRNIDEVRVTKGVCRYTEDFVVQGGEHVTNIPTYDDYADPYWENVVLHTDFDTTDIPIDNSNSKHVLTLGSGASLDVIKVKYGEAAIALNNTTNGYVQAPSSTDWHLDDFNFTLEAWVNWDAVPSTDDDIINVYDAASNQRSWFLRWDNGVDNLAFQYSTNGTAFTELLSGGTFEPAQDTWYHIACCRVGANILFFVDGVQLGTGTNIGTDAIFNSSTALRIGERVDGTSPIDATIDGVRVTKGVARYTADFIVPPRAHPTQGSDLYFEQVMSYAPLSEAAGSYREESPILQAEESSVGAFSDSGVTTEVTAANLLFNDVVADVDATDAGQIIIGDPHWDSVVLLIDMEDDPPVDHSQSAHTVVDGGAGATLDTTIFKTGLASFAMDGSSTGYLQVADHADFQLGANDFTLEGWFRFSDGTLHNLFNRWVFSSDQRSYALQINSDDTIDYLFSTTGSGFSVLMNNVPTPITTDTWFHIAISRSGGYTYLFIDGILMEQAADANTYFVGTSHLRLSGIGNGGDELNGNMDSIRITNGVGRYTGTFTPPPHDHSSPRVIPLTGPFTAEGWVRWETDPATAVSIIAGQWNEADDQRCWKIELNNNNLRFAYSTDGASGTVVNTDKAFDPAADTWYHWAITRDASNDMRWFINGVQIGSTSNITAEFHPSSALTILGETEDHVPASTQIYLAHCRFTPEVARYTADFIPAAGPFATKAVDPRDLGNIDVWYDTSTAGGLETDALADVVKLIDQNGAEHASNATVSERPTVLSKSDANAINNKRTVDFDGLTQLLKLDVGDNRWDGADLPLTIGVSLQLLDIPTSNTTDNLVALSNTEDSDTYMALGVTTNLDTLAPNWKITRTDDGATSVTTTDTTTEITNGTTNLVMVFHGTTVSLWVDGVKTIDAISMDVGTMLVNQITLGAANRGDSESEHITARIGEVVIYDEALGDDAAVILSGYLGAKWSVVAGTSLAPSAATAGDPHWESVTLHSHMDVMPPLDLSLNALTFTDGGVGATLDAVNQRFGDGCSDFDGTSGGYVELAANTAWHFGTNDFTVEVWARWNAAPTGTKSIIGAWTTSGSQLSFLLRHDGTQLDWFSSPDGSATNEDSFTFTPVVDQWYHIAVTRSNGIGRIHVDGEVRVAFADAVDYHNSTGVMRIGDRSDGAHLFDGKIDEVRITNGVDRYA